MRRALAACGVLLVAMATFAVPGARAQAVTDLSTALASLNGSGATGDVTIEVGDDEVTVRLEANGVSPNLPHAQHIHIGGQNVCPPPSAGAATEPTNLIDTVEGQPFYGGIQVSLTTEGDVSAASGLAVDRFPVADAEGTYVYERSFALPEGVTVDALVDGVIVVHGIADLEIGDDPSAYDGPVGPLTAGSQMELPLEATIPAACGELVEGDLTDVGAALPISDVCPAEDVPDPGFTDVDEDNVHQEAIACIAFYGITEGTTASTYSPENPVPRDQMATFIADLIEAVEPGALEAVSDEENAFPCTSNADLLTTANVHYENIQLLADAGIVNGGPGGLPGDCYGPERLVTRAQMASFINQTQEFLGTEASTEDNFFVDDEDSVHEANINAIASEGIAVGAGNARFLPGQDIPRDQMASFLAQKLAYLFAEGAVEVPDQGSNA